MDGYSGVVMGGGMMGIDPPQSFFPS